MRHNGDVVCRKPVAKLGDPPGGNGRVGAGGVLIQEKLVGPDRLDGFCLIPAGLACLPTKSAKPFN